MTKILQSIKDTIERYCYIHADRFSVECAYDNNYFLIEYNTEEFSRDIYGKMNEDGSFTLTNKLSYKEKGWTQKTLIRTKEEFIMYIDTFKQKKGEAEYITVIRDSE